MFNIQAYPLPIAVYLTNAKVINKFYSFQHQKITNSFSRILRPFLDTSVLGGVIIHFDKNRPK